MNFEVEIRAANQLTVLYVKADSEAQALLKARAHARRTLSATAFRFATFMAW